VWSWDFGRVHITGQFYQVGQKFYVTQFCYSSVRRLETMLQLRRIIKRQRVSKLTRVWAECLKRVANCCCSSRVIALCFIGLIYAMPNLLHIYVMHYAREHKYILYSRLVVKHIVTIISGIILQVSVSFLLFICACWFLEVKIALCCFWAVSFVVYFSPAVSRLSWIFLRLSRLVTNVCCQPETSTAYVSERFAASPDSR